MKRTYKIVRYNNGWAADIEAGDNLMNRSGVYEDPDKSEEGENPKLESLLNLILNTFKEFRDVDLYYTPIEEEGEEENERSERS